MKKFKIDTKVDGVQNTGMLLACMAYLIVLIVTWPHVGR